MVNEEGSVLAAFQMPSGHHQVADAVMDAIMERFSHVICQKLIV